MIVVGRHSSPLVGGFEGVGRGMTSNTAPRRACVEGDEDGGKKNGALDGVDKAVKRIVKFTALPNCISRSHGTSHNNVSIDQLTTTQTIHLYSYETRHLIAEYIKYKRGVCVNNV